MHWLLLGIASSVSLTVFTWLAARQWMLSPRKASIPPRSQRRHQSRNGRARQ